MIADQIAGKRLALLKQMIPRSTRIAVLTQTNHSASIGQVKAAREAAKTLDIELEVIEARDARDYETVFTDLRQNAQALFVVANPTFFAIESCSARSRRSTAYRCFANGGRWRLLVV